jgi:hypothetical protein
VVDILLVVFAQGGTAVWRGGVITNDGVSFPGPCLSVGKDGDVGPGQELIDGLLQQVKDVLLGGIVRQDVTKLHVGEISRPFNEQGFLVLEFDELSFLFLIENRPNAD